LDPFLLDRALACFDLSAHPEAPMLAWFWVFENQQGNDAMDVVQPVASINVLGEPLEPCSTNPMTGFFRNGQCDTCAQDAGSHTVCAVMTEAFLEFSKSVGNDLSTPRPEFGFKGLRAGDKWCLCASRFVQAYQAGHAPRVSLCSTHKVALEIVPMELLRERALERN
jgi:uncharacterized protein (DUF2237 family)